MEEKSGLASSSSSPSRPADRHSEGRSLPLKARYGVNAWKRWALSPPDQSDDTKVKDGTKLGKLNKSVLLSVLAKWLQCASECVAHLKMKG